MKRVLITIFLILIPLSQLFSLGGATSYPYVSGYTWAFFCDHRLIGEDYGSGAEDFDPESVHLGDTIFIDYLRLEEFGRDYLPRIRDKVILITSNYGWASDFPSPGPFDYLLKEDKVAAWFVQNIDREPSDKLFPIPIGISSRHRPYGDIHMLERWIPYSLAKKEKPKFIYLNFTPWPNRIACAEHFIGIGIHFSREKPYESFLAELSESIFVISPPGKGEDCHRTWEALLMGCYPVVKSSTLNPLFEDLPVVIVDDWTDATLEFLENKYRELGSKAWSRDKLYAPYWFQKVQEVQDRLRDPISARK